MLTGEKWWNKESGLCAIAPFKFVTVSRAKSASVGGAKHPSVGVAQATSVGVAKLPSAAWLRLPLWAWLSFPPWVWLKLPLWVCLSIPPWVWLKMPRGRGSGFHCLCLLQWGILKILSLGGPGHRLVATGAVLGPSDFLGSKLADSFLVSKGVLG